MRLSFESVDTIKQVPSPVWMGLIQLDEQNKKDGEEGTPA